MDYSLPGSSVHGILEGKNMEVSCHFLGAPYLRKGENCWNRRVLKQFESRDYHIYVRVYAHLLSCVRLFAIPWTIVCQAPLSIGFSWWEYWSGLSFPTPGGLSDPGIEPMSPVSPYWQADSLPLNHIYLFIFILYCSYDIALHIINP